MPSLRKQIKEPILDLAWSLWTELGVRGVTRRHQRIGIDIEPLILFTSRLRALDARLVEEAFDWCVKNWRVVSADRLRNLAKAESPQAQDAYAPFAAAVRGHRRVNWPGAAAPLELRLTGRSGTPDLSRPALIQLRLRALFGVSARAEALRWLLSEPDSFVGILELSRRMAYGKDNVADTLELLEMGGLLSSTVLTAEGGLRLYKLDRNSKLARALMSEVSVEQPRWDARFRLTEALLQFVSSQPEDAHARATSIMRLLGELESDLRWLNAYPHLRQGVEAVNADFDEWAITVVRHWASGG